MTTSTTIDDNDDEKNGLYYNFMLLPPNPILQISQNSMWCKTTSSPLSW